MQRLKFGLPLVAIALYMVGVGLLCSIGCKDSPSAKPSTTLVENAVRTTSQETAANYATAFESAANQVRSKKIVHARQLLEFVSAETKQARERGREAFDKQWAADIPSEEISDAIATADKIDEYAKAWRSLAK